MPMGKERNKEQLYREAKRLNIKGRSKMNKGALKAALEAIPADLRKDSEALRDLLRQAIRKAVRKTTGTRPMVVPVILEG